MVLRNRNDCHIALVPVPAVKIPVLLSELDLVLSAALYCDYFPVCGPVEPVVAVAALLALVLLGLVAVLGCIQRWFGGHIAEEGHDVVG